MSCRTVMRTVLLSEPWRLSLHHHHRPILSDLRSRARILGGPLLRCSHDDASSPPPPSSDDQGPPQEVVLKAISEVSKSEGRVAQTTNVVIGGTVTDDATDEWLVLDQKVNSYPMVRGFTAIGTGGDDFVQAMVVAVESVIQQPVPEGRVTQKLSSGGKYVSVNIGPIRVVSSEQVSFLPFHTISSTSRDVSPPNLLGYQPTTGKKSDFNLRLTGQGLLVMSPEFINIASELCIDIFSGSSCLQCHEER